MVGVNFEAIDMEEKYYEILRHYVNPNDCATVVRQLLNLHDVSKSFYCNHSRWWKLKNTIIGTICFKCRYK